jgi:hypothetical protein
MTTSKVKRVTAGALDGSFGPDSDRRIVLTFIPGDGKPNGIKDVLQLRPLRTRRAETIAVIDVYRFALRSRVNQEVLAKAREKKERKQIRLARARQERAEKRLFSNK